MNFKRDVLIDREDLDLTRFFLKSEDARAWAEDQDGLTVISENGHPVVEVAHEQAAEMENRMREDCLTFV